MKSWSKVARQQCLQDLEVSGHIVFTVKKQGVIDSNSWIAFTCVHTLRPENREWCHPHLVRLLISVDLSR